LSQKFFRMASVVGHFYFQRTCNFSDFW